MLFVFTEALLKHGLLLVIRITADDDCIVVHAGEMGDGGGALLAQRQSLFDPDAAVICMVRELGVVRVAALCTSSAHGRQTLPIQRSVCHGGASHYDLFLSAWQGRHHVAGIARNDGGVGPALRGGCCAVGDYRFGGCGGHHVAFGYFELRAVRLVTLLTLLLLVRLRLASC
eukprot:5931438-Ditylum_brightwellii.AAC.1